MRPQHLTAVRATAAICQAKVTGAALNSHSLTFTPKPRHKEATTPSTWPTPLKAVQREPRPSFTDALVAAAVCRTAVAADLARRYTCAF
ncbi:MAG: RNA 3'-terminal phosphate cyclase [Chloroflexi bacterium]|nr:RNA 3'-terminal phosphate cyclase [Chloroflexota bacterium]